MNQQPFNFMPTTVGQTAVTPISLDLVEKVLKEIKEKEIKEFGTHAPNDIAMYPKIRSTSLSRFMSGAGSTTWSKIRSSNPLLGAGSATGPTMLSSNPPLLLWGI